MRVPGSYRLVLAYADAAAARESAVDSDVVDARFVEIVPGKRVVKQIERLPPSRLLLGGNEGLGLAPPRRTCGSASPPACLSRSGHPRSKPAEWRGFSPSSISGVRRNARRGSLVVRRRSMRQ